MSNATTVLQGLAGVYGPVQEAIFAIATLLGAILFVVAILRLRRANATGDTPAPAFAAFAASIFLFSISQMMTKTTQSFLPGASPLQGMAYTHPSGSLLQVFAQTAVGAIVILGWIGSLTGLYMFSEVGGRQSNPMLAIKLLIGGALAVNIVRVIAAATSTLHLGTGWESTLGI